MTDSESNQELLNKVGSSQVQDISYVVAKQYFSKLGSNL